MPPRSRETRRAPRRLDFEAFARLTELADYFVPFMIRAVCELGIADELTSGPRPVEELAAATGTHAPSLQRVLRALAVKDVFAEVEPGIFSLTSLGDLLAANHPYSLRDAYHLMRADVLSWASFVHSLRTGEASFPYVHGRGLWEYLAENPEDGRRFDRGMEALTRPELRTLLAAYDWSNLGTVVDVGGGNGAFLAGLLARQPALRGVLFDLPHVVARAPTVLVEADVADRCDIVAGDFFDRVPAGGDAYVLKRILYSWEDDRAVDLLRTVRAALSPHSRVLIVEPVAGLGAPQFGAVLDVVMLAVDGGRVRSREELDTLFAAADLRLTQTVPAILSSIVEARPT